mmetsp:Transcript_3417/g.7815  ORF Transcript_3417/g.7815 Transcript_3417/m.7815 type:complete len:142 (+) Transcript_3417:292-717(+)
MIDRRFAAATTATTTPAAAVSWKTVAGKTVAAQLVLFPPYLVLLFGSLGVLEDHPDVVQKIRGGVPGAFRNGCLYWPVVNAVGFKIVPNHLRVPYVALSAGAWNSYLSFANGSGNNNNNNNNGNQAADNNDTNDGDGDSAG